MDDMKRPKHATPHGRQNLPLQEEYFLAVKNKDVKRVTELLRSGVDPNCVFDDVINGGMTAVHSSVLADSFGMVQCLLENGANINLADWDGETPIFAAIFKTDDRIRKLLIEKGADVNLRSKSGETPLMKALDESETFNFELKYSVVSDFLQAQSNFHQKDKDGRSLLHFVSVVHDRCKGDHNCLTYLDYLLDGRVRLHGTTTDFFGQTPLHRAATSCCFDAVNFLIEHGCEPTLQDNNLKTALHCLGEHPNRTDFTRILELLIKTRCNINATDYIGRMPLHYVTASNDTCAEAVEAMIRHGAIEDHQDKCGHNPLHLCVHPGVVTDYSDVVGDKKNAENIADVVKVLVDNGIDVNAIDNDSFTPLHFAVRQRNIRVIETLLHLGADPSLATKTGETAVHRATISTTVLNIIIDHMKQTNTAIDLNVTDNFGSTPLHWAVSLIEHGSVKRLLFEGCHQIPDGNRRSPADLACLFRFACLYESLGICNHRGVFPINFEISPSRYVYLLTHLLHQNANMLTECETSCKSDVESNDSEMKEDTDNDDNHMEREQAYSQHSSNNGENSNDDDDIDVDEEEEDGNDDDDADDSAKKNEDAESGAKAIDDELEDEDLELYNYLEKDNYKQRGEQEENVIGEAPPSEVTTDNEDDGCPGKDELYLDCPVLQTIYNENSKVCLTGWETHLVLHQQSLSAYSKLVLDAKLMGLVIETEENEQIAMAITEIMNISSKLVSSENPHLFCDVNLAGSRREGTKKCCLDEFDFSWNLIRFSEALIAEESAEFPAEFVRLRLKDEYKNTKFADFVTKDYTLDGRKLVRSLYMAINEVLFRQKNGMLSHMYCRKYLRIDKGSIDNLAFRWVGNVYKDLLVEVDIAPRFVFPGWVPQQIDLNSALYRNAVNSQEPLPPFAVVVKTPDGRYVKDWQHYCRIDVAQLESILIRNAPESARKGFILLKALRDSLYMPQIYDEKMDDWVRSFLTTYMLKTCLLHELNEETNEKQESRETRTDEKLVHRREAISWAFKIMKRLHLSVSESELVSFFVPGVNLLVNQSLEVVNDQYLIGAECVCLNDLLIMGTVD